METTETKNEKRRTRTTLERLRIVEETMQAGASVARVARTHGVNANQLFHWRKLYREGRLEVENPSSALLQVKITEPIEANHPRSKPQVRTTEAGTIDIDLGHARVRIEGRADPDCVRAAVEGLVR